MKLTMLKYEAYDKNDDSFAYTYTHYHIVVCI